MGSEREQCPVCDDGCTCVSPSQMRELASLLNPAAEAEVEQLRALLRQVREATGHVKWAHDICHLIDESELLGEPSDG
jgi:hypothetical protein